MSDNQPKAKRVAMAASPSPKRRKSPTDATRAPSARKARVVMPRGASDSRTLVHLIAGFIQRIDIARRKVHLGDMDQALVAGVVAVGSLDHLVRQPTFRDTYGDYREIVGVEGQRGVNALSVAGATGIPRETVRRKLKELVARGIVMEKVRGRYIMSPGFLQRKENAAAIDGVIRHFLQLVNEGIGLGVLRVEDESE
jgi:hypothetical protein